MLPCYAAATIGAMNASPNTESQAVNRKGGRCLSKDWVAESVGPTAGTAFTDFCLEVGWCQTECLLLSRMRSRVPVLGIGSRSRAGEQDRCALVPETFASIQRRLRRDGECHALCPAGMLRGNVRRGASVSVSVSTCRRTTLLTLSSSNQNLTHKCLGSKEQFPG